MEVKGKLIKKLDLETGISKAGKEWKKQSIVIDTGNDFNNEVCVSAFGDKVGQMNKLEIGMEVSVLCNVYSIEYNGRYFHNIDGYFFTNQTNKPPQKMTTGEEDMPF
jgi:hypothetical protein